MPKVNENVKKNKVNVKKVGRNAEKRAVVEPLALLEDEITQKAFFNVWDGDLLNRLMKSQILNENDVDEEYRQFLDTICFVSFSTPLTPSVSDSNVGSENSFKIRNVSGTLVVSKDALKNYEIKCNKWEKGRKTARNSLFFQLGMCYDKYFSSEEKERNPIAQTKLFYFEGEESEILQDYVNEQEYNGTVYYGRVKIPGDSFPTSCRTGYNYGYYAYFEKKAPDGELLQNNDVKKKKFEEFHSVLLQDVILKEEKEKEFETKFKDFKSFFNNNVADFSKEVIFDSGFCDRKGNQCTINYISSFSFDGKYFGRVRFGLSQKPSQDYLRQFLGSFYKLAAGLYEIEQARKLYLHRRLYNIPFVIRDKERSQLCRSISEWEFVSDNIVSTKNLSKSYMKFIRFTLENPGLKKYLDKICYVELFLPANKLLNSNGQDEYTELQSYFFAPSEKKLYGGNDSLSSPKSPFDRVKDELTREKQEREKDGIVSDSPYSPFFNFSRHNGLGAYVSTGEDSREIREEFLINPLSEEFSKKFLSSVIIEQANAYVKYFKSLPSLEVRQLYSCCRKDCRCLYEKTLTISRTSQQNGNEQTETRDGVPSYSSKQIKKIQNNISKTLENFDCVTDGVDLKTLIDDIHKNLFQDIQILRRRNKNAYLPIEKILGRIRNIPKRLDDIYKKAVELEGRLKKLESFQNIVNKLKDSRSDLENSAIEDYIRNEKESYSDLDKIRKEIHTFNSMLEHLNNYVSPQRAKGSESSTEISTETANYMQNLKDQIEVQREKSKKWCEFPGNLLQKLSPSLNGPIPFNLLPLKKVGDMEACLKYIQKSFGITEPNGFPDYEISLCSTRYHKINYFVTIFKEVYSAEPERKKPSESEARVRASESINPKNDVSFLTGMKMSLQVDEESRQTNDFRCGMWRRWSVLRNAELVDRFHRPYCVDVFIPLFFARRAFLISVGFSSLSDTYKIFVHKKDKKQDDESTLLDQTYFDELVESFFRDFEALRFEQSKRIDKVNEKKQKLFQYLYLSYSDAHENARNFAAFRQSFIDFNDFFQKVFYSIGERPITDEERRKIRNGKNWKVFERECDGETLLDFSDCPDKFEDIYSACDRLVQNLHNIQDVRNIANSFIGKSKPSAEIQGEVFQEKTTWNRSDNLDLKKLIVSEIDSINRSERPIKVSYDSSFENNLAVIKPWIILKEKKIRPYDGFYKYFFTDLLRNASKVNITVSEEGGAATPNLEIGLVSVDEKTVKIKSSISSCKTAVVLKNRISIDGVQNMEYKLFNRWLTLDEYGEYIGKQHFGGLAERVYIFDKTKTGFIRIMIEKKPDAPIFYFKVALVFEGLTMAPVKKKLS